MLLVTRDYSCGAEEDRCDLAIEGRVSVVRTDVMGQIFLFGLKRRGKGSLWTWEIKEDLEHLTKKRKKEAREEKE